MILAELNIRHTRRHQPTRRVALGDHYLPTSGPAYGAVLLGAVVSENLGGLDDEQRDLLPRLLADAEDGLSVPRIALRHRLQTDTHGLDRSRHRIVADGGPLVLELDTHGWPTPQVLGAVMAAAQLPSSARRPAFRSLAAAVAYSASAARIAIWAIRSSSGSLNVSPTPVIPDTPERVLRA